MNRALRRMKESTVRNKVTKNSNVRYYKILTEFKHQVSELLLDMFIEQTDEKLKEIHDVAGTTFSYIGQHRKELTNTLNVSGILKPRYEIDYDTIALDVVEETKDRECDELSKAAFMMDKIIRTYFIEKELLTECIRYMNIKTSDNFFPFGDANEDLLELQAWYSDLVDESRKLVSDAVFEYIEGIIEDLHLCSRNYNEFSRNVKSLVDCAGRITAKGVNSMAILIDVEYAGVLADVSMETEKLIRASCVNIIMNDMGDYIGSNPKVSNELLDYYRLLLESFGEEFVIPDYSEENEETDEIKFIDSYRELSDFAKNKGFVLIRSNGDHGIFRDAYGNVVIIPQGRSVGRGLSLRVQKYIIECYNNGSSEVKFF